jgi:hypothetical protein
MPATVAARLGVKDVTLTDWRFRKRGPKWVKVGRLVRYPSALLEQWIAARLQGDAAQQEGDSASERRCRRPLTPPSAAMRRFPSLG